MLQKGGIDYLTKESPDIFFAQETKIDATKPPPEADLEDYHITYNAAEKKGYSGVALFSKKVPLSVTKGMGESALSGGVSQNLSSVTNDSFCYKLLKTLLLIGYQQICHWFLSFVIEESLCETGPSLPHHGWIFKQYEEDFFKNNFLFRGIYSVIKYI